MSICRHQHFETELQWHRCVGFDIALVIVSVPGVLLLIRTGSFLAQALSILHYSKDPCFRLEKNLESDASNSLVSL